MTAKQVIQTKKVSKTVIATAIIIGLVLGVFGIRWLKKNKTEPVASDFRPHVLGPDSAPIKILEFIDLQCPACAQGAKIIKKVMELHPGVIQVELRYHPLNSHKFGFLSARYAECGARQGKLWEFAGAILESQSQWANVMNPIPIFESLARNTGVDLNSLSACLADPSVDQYLTKDREEGVSRGVRSTPTYFINGEMLVGSRDLEEKLNKLIAEKFSSAAQ